MCLAWPNTFDVNREGSCSSDTRKSRDFRFMVDV
jgi:hypothetical protein